MASFVAVLRAMGGAAPAGGYHKAEWLAYVPAESAYSSGQQQLVVGIMSAILANEAATEGLLETMGDTEQAAVGGMPAFNAMMKSLYQKILDPGRGAPVTTERLSGFTMALKSAIEGSEDPKERDAIKAFVRVLERMAVGRKTFTLQEWTSYKHEGSSYTPDEQRTFITILTSILSSNEAVEGLMETMDPKA